MLCISQFLIPPYHSFVSFGFFHSHVFLAFAISCEFFSFFPHIIEGEWVRFRCEIIKLLIGLCGVALNGLGFPSLPEISHASNVFENLLHPRVSSLFATPLHKLF